MRKSDKLAKTIARLDEVYENFEALESREAVDPDGNRVYPISAVAELLELSVEDAKFERIVNSAKITIRKSGKKIAEHILPANFFEGIGEEAVTVYAAFLIIFNAGPESDLVARAQDYFASKANANVLEEEKRLRNRFDVVEENKRLAAAAKNAGVQKFAVFNAAGYRGLYGGMDIHQVASKKGLEKASDVLDFAGSEELAAHLFRITQTKAALEREQIKSEWLACQTHQRMGGEVRRAIHRMGGTMPENLPAARERIDVVVDKTAKRLEH